MSRAEQRAEALLGSMTWDEKLAQMQVVFRPDPAELERWVRGGVGAIFGRAAQPRSTPCSGSRSSRPG